MHRAESQLPVSAYGTGMKPRFRTKQSQNIECLRPLICFRLFYSPFPPPPGWGHRMADPGGTHLSRRRHRRAKSGRGTMPPTRRRNPGGAQSHRPDGAQSARTNGAVSVPPPYAGVRARPDSLTRVRVVTVCPKNSGAYR